MSENTNNHLTKKDVVHREFLINANINQNSVEDVILGISAINRYDDANSSNKVEFERKPIKITIDSFGGECYAGMSLVNAINSSKTPIHTYCYGIAMSMGLTIYASGHKRFAHANATFMQHQLSGGMNGKLTDMIESVEQKLKLQIMMDNVLSENSFIGKEKLEELRKTKTDWFFSGAEALELGVVDEIIQPTFKRELKKAHEVKYND